MKSMYLKRLSSALILVLFSAMFLSCGIGATKIGDIISHPRDYAGKEVTVAGEVTETFSLVVVKYFMVRDGSGEITVVTQRPLPAKGEKIKVTGIVREAFSIGPKTSLVLMESVKKGE